MKEKSKGEVEKKGLIYNRYKKKWNHQYICCKHVHSSFTALTRESLEQDVTGWMMGILCLGSYIQTGVVGRLFSFFS